MEKLRRVIGISGERLSGKDTVAKLLIDNLPHYKRAALADPLKETYAKLMEIDLKILHTQCEAKEEHRIGLITLGAVRRSDNIDWWCKELKKSISNDFIIIPDIRFLNEIEYFQNNSDIFILLDVVSSEKEKIKRGWKPSKADNDKSEIERLKFLDKVNFTIENNETLEELEEDIKQIANLFK